MDNKAHLEAISKIFRKHCECEKSETRAWSKLIIDVADSNKVVVVVGAGLSTEARIKTANELLHHIEKKFPLVRFLLQDRPDKLDYFTVLAAFRDVAGEDAFWRFLEDELAPEDYGPLPASYELLTHLLAHEVVDCVISLNHDELFDNLLKVETHSSNGSSIIEPTSSLSQFAALRDKLTNGSPTKRAYLKPHGTISRHLTIRTESNSIRRFESVKQDVIRTYLKDARVVTLGWGLRDPDMLSLINSARTKSSPPNVVVDIPSEKWNEFRDESFNLVLSGAAPFLTAWLEAIEYRKKQSNSLASEGGGHTTQRSVGPLRHYIRNAFFSAPDKYKKEFPVYPATLERQVALEIIMFALKARGHFEPRVLLSCPRTSSLARLMHGSKRKNGARKWTLGDVLHQLCNKDAKVLERAENNNMEPIYWLHAPLDQKGSADSFLRTIAQFSFDQLQKNFAQPAWGSTPTRSCVMRLDAKAGMAKHFYELTRTFDVDIDADPLGYPMFRQAESIKNRDELTAKTIAVLQHMAQKGSELLVSTYTGEWLLNADFAKHFNELNFKISAVVDDYDAYSASPYSSVAKRRVDQLKQRYQKHINVKSLPEKVHNITLVIDKSQSPLAGIYFYRRSKSTQICPVYITDESDLHLLKRMWLGIWCRANNCLPEG